MGRISKTFKTTYLIIKAVLIAFFFIYVVNLFWLTPFNFLLPSHFDVFSAATPLGRAITGSGFFISFFAATLYINRYQKDLKLLFPSAPSNWKTQAKGFVIISLLTFFLTAMTLFISMALGFTGFDINEEASFFTPFFQSFEYTFLMGIYTYIGVALAEEMVYRGLIFRYLFKKTSNLQLALIISSLIFSLLHFYEDNPLIYIAAFLIGYLLALIYYHSGSLLYCIAIHWAYDMFQFFGKNYLHDYLDLEPSLIDGWGYYFTLVRIVALVLIILVLKFYMKKNKIKKVMKDQAIA